MSYWYDKYLSIYGKPFSDVPQQVIDETRERLAALQSDEPLASIVVIGYNEETHLQACLWAISEIKCKYPVEIIGVDNDSKNRTAEIYEKSGIPWSKMLSTQQRMYCSTLNTGTIILRYGRISTFFSCKFTGFFLYFKILFVFLHVKH